MASERESPLVVRNFQVRVAVLGPKGGRVAESEVACSAVVLPAFRLDRWHERNGDEPADGASPDNLVLRRGHTGSTTFYEWWRAERDSERDRVREVSVILLDEALEPVTEWRFTSCQVVSLDYSTLDALAVDVVIESLELAFETVEQFGRNR